MDFICSFDIFWYPFDTQICKGEFRPDGTQIDFVDLNPQNITYYGNQDVSSYQIGSIKLLKITNLDKRKYLSIQVVLQRRLLNDLLNVYLPGLMLVLISFCSNYFGADEFKSVVAVNLTCLLVNVTLFLGISSR